MRTWLIDELPVLIGANFPADMARQGITGHSMGGHVATLYAGVRPERVAKLINLEGFGMPATRPQQAPSRYARWLDQLKSPASLQAYPSAQAVANRLQKNNPRLTRDRAEWLATHWAREGDDGRWHLKADPAHKHISPLLYQKDEALACWARITAPMLWVEGDQTHIFGTGHEGNPWWGDAYPRTEFEARLGVVPQVERCLLKNAGHMLHHDQPEALAEAILSFLDA
jgi:pimeloyl-ACP methyl ester carboxylesterase